MIKHSPIYAFIKEVTPTGSRVLQASENYQDMIGISGSEMVGKTMGDLFPSEFAARITADDWTVVSNGQVLKLDEDLNGRNYTTIKFPVSLGGKTLLAGYSIDITERKRAEEALRESEERFRLSFENANVGMCLVNLAGRLTKVNHQMCEIFGYSQEELEGMTVNDIAHPEDSNLSPAFIQRAASGEVERTTFEKRYFRKDGHIVWGQVSSSLVRTAQGAPMYFISHVQDITERKRAEEALRHQLTEMEAVHTVSAALRTAQTLDEALPIVLDQTLAALETDAGTIWLYDPASRTLRVAVNRGWFAQLDDAPMKPNEGIAGKVFANGQPHLSTEFARDPVARPPASGEIPAGWGGACVPIRTATESIGVLFISVPLPRQITPEQMRLLGSLAEMAGAALHRMRLHEETVRHLNYLQALHEIDRVISASFDLRLTLNLLVERIVAQLGVDAADVLLLHPHQQTLDYAAGHGFRTRAIQDAHLRLGERFAGHVALERRTLRVSGSEMMQENTRFATLCVGEKFVEYYGVPLIVKGQVKGVLEIFSRAPLSHSGGKSEWLDALETFAMQAAIAIDNAQLFENLERSNQELAVAYDTTIEGWSRALEVRGRETQGHTQRVAEMTIRLAQALNLSEAAIIHIRRGALLHDIGKMGVTDFILHKPNKLTEAEWTIMRQHPQVAHDLLAPITYLHPALDIPHCHHEKWDGTGYPRGLQGEQIPLAARLFAIVDVWDALTSDRPYRPAWSRDKAIEYIREQSGKHFDPQVVEVFLGIVTDF